MEWLFKKTNKNYSVEDYLITLGNVSNSEYTFEALWPQKWICFMILILFLNLFLYFAFIY